MSNPTNSSEPGGTFEAVLLADYAASRFTHERVDATGLGLLGLTSTITGILLAGLLRSCDPATLECTPSLWPPLYSGLPAVPIALLLLFADLSNTRTMRSLYVRELERRMRIMAGIDDKSARDAIDDGTVLPALYGELHAVVFGQRRGFPRYRSAVGFVYLVLGSLLMALIVLAIELTKPLELQIVAGCIYAFLLVLLARMLWMGTRGSRIFWSQSLGSLKRSLSLPTRRGVSRGTFAYAVLPRPRELLVRTPLVPLAYALGALSLGDATWGGVLCSFLIGLCFEFIVYQGRYIVNDLRGLGADNQFSDFRARSRFPTPATRRSVSVAFYSVLLRLVLAVALPVYLGYPSVLWVLLALASQALLYEVARARVSRESTAAMYAKHTPGKVVIYVVAGLGYAIRGLVGVLVVGYSIAEPLNASAPLILQVIGWWAFGVMTVTAAWSFVLCEQVIEPFPSARIRAAVAPWAHLGPLARQAGVIAEGCSFLDVAGDPVVVGQGSRTRVLVDRAGGTWWNVSYCLLNGVAVLSVLLAAPGAAWKTTLGVLVSFIAGVIVVGIPRWMSRRNVPQGLSIASALGVAIIASSGASYMLDAPAWAGWYMVAQSLVFTGTYLLFRFATLQLLQRSAIEVRTAFGEAYWRAFANLMNVFLGGAARDAVNRARS